MKHFNFDVQPVKISQAKHICLLYMFKKKQTKYCLLLFGKVIEEGKKEERDENEFARIFLEFCLSLCCWYKTKQNKQKTKHTKPTDLPGWTNNTEGKEKKKIS